MKLVGLTALSLAAVALANNQRENFAANKAERRAAILAQKMKAWQAKLEARAAKDAENESVRQAKDEAKANSWAIKEAVREAKDEANQGVRDEKDAAKANSWAIKEAIRELKDKANEIIRERKDAAKANSWEIRQVIRDRKDQMKAKTEFNKATARAAEQAIRDAFFEKRADELVNFNVARAGLRDDDMYCFNSDDVSATWSESSNSISIEGWQNVHNGAVAIGRTSAQSGNYFVTLVGGVNKKVYAVSGEGNAEATHSPFGKYDDIFWSISGSQALSPSNEELVVEVAHASDYSGADLTWYLCTQRKDESNPCQSEPCKNGGECTVSDEAADCDCTPAFYGPTCDSCVCDNSSDMTSCQNFVFLLDDTSFNQGCDYLPHCNMNDACDRFESKCAAMQGNCGSDELSVYVPCVLLEVQGKYCDA